MDKEILAKIYREIPPINILIEREEIILLIESYGRDRILETIREAIESFRKEPNVFSREEIIMVILKKVKDRLEEEQLYQLKKVINATGIVLHTNLGRAPLSEKAMEALCKISQGYCNLEYNLKEGERGSRYSHLEPLLKKLTGAEAALVVNNNAAAVFLALNTIALNKEVIISRGQQVEIGGSFRIPDIINRSGCRMVEVGTTNKTKLKDYKREITENTGVLLKVHTSNYKVVGFTEEVALEELVALAKESKVLVMEDLGSGSLYDLSKLGLPNEPTVQDSVIAGADIITFSGDKLLGGPQAGIIVGKKEIIEKIKKNPLTRMLRCDKLTIMALYKTLEEYLLGDAVINNVPTLKMMWLKEAELREKAEVLASIINEKNIDGLKIFIVSDEDKVGGGSLPDLILKGVALELYHPSVTANTIQQRLRKANTPIISKIRQDKVILNVRTIFEHEYEIVANILIEILGE